METMNIYAVSDSLGETAELVAQAVSKQFDIVNFEIKTISYVSDITIIDKIIDKAKLENAIIVFTIIIEEIRDYLVKKAEENNVIAVDLMTPILIQIVNKLGLTPKREPGLLRKMDDKYFKKVEAVEFAVRYDDGKDTRGIMLADIVLIGVSRSSKTPLSMYLAHKNIKVANVPLVPEVQLPDELFCIPKEKIIGLRIDSEQLIKIRKERLKALGLRDTASYANIERIMEEIEYSNKVMEKIGCRIIDTTNKAVEEIASIILEDSLDIPSFEIK